MNKRNLVLTGIVLGLSSLSFVAGLAIAKGAAKPPVLTPLSEQKWSPLMKEGPLPAYADIQGDGMKGAHYSYLKLPAGFVSPPHSHSSDYWAVLLQGKMTHWAPNVGSETDAKQLGVGDLTFMPAKTEHVSKCFPGVECVMAMVQKGKFDFIAAKAPPPAAPEKAEKPEKKK